MSSLTIVAARQGSPGGSAHLRLVPPLDADLRLTSRGRVALIALIALLVALVGLTVGRGGAGPSGGPLAPISAADAAVTVQPGETLWGIARRVAPGRDPRLVIAGIARHNGLSSSHLSAGQELIIPLARP